MIDGTRSIFTFARRPPPPIIPAEGATLYAVQYLDEGTPTDAEFDDPEPWEAKPVGFGVSRGLQVAGELRVPVSEIDGSPAKGSTLYVGAGKATTVSPTIEGDGVRVVGWIVDVSGSWASVLVSGYPLTVVLDEDLTS